jgi:hypothetical protein
LSGQAELHDTRALEALIGVVSRLPALCVRVRDAATEDAEPRLRRLEEAIEELKDQVRRLRSLLEEARSRGSDDDEEADGSYADGLEAELEAAEERLRRLETAAQEVQRALGRYRSAAGRLEALDRESLAPAGRYLEDVLAASQVYDAISVPRANVAASGVLPPASAAPRAAEERDLPPLPPGFNWIPIDRTVLDEANLGPPKGVSRETIETGLRAFQADMLPRFQAGRASRDEFFALDRELGRESHGQMPADNLANLYDLLFGDDAIAVSPLADGHYSFSSGRHRTAIARALGWSHVPGRILGGRNG